MDERPGDKWEKMQLGAWGREWIPTLIHHSWLAAEQERQKQRQRETRSNKWIQGRGWALLPGLSGPLAISAAADRWSCHCPLRPTHHRVCNWQAFPSPGSFPGGGLFSPWTKCRRVSVLLSEVSITAYFRKVCLHVPIHPLRLWPCQSLLGANVGSMPIMFILSSQLISRHYIKRLQEVG